MGELRTISQSEEPFWDRAEAGRILAGELCGLSGSRPVVLGIPRCGVMVASEIARILGADLDVVVARKLCEPGNPDIPIGAINEDGKLFLARESPVLTGLCEGYENTEEDLEKQYTMIAWSIEKYRGIRPRVPLAGRTVIITDDGLSSGMAMQAALWTVREEKPEKLIAAVPVASMEGIERISDFADETVVLKTPPVFYDVGQFYEYFDKTTDEQVIAALKESMERSIVM
ncbi:MAG TPA: phosphoribosyltransferase family protein [Deltaproteobacteria bacterium]|jgi:hypothetical protein|nr:phosphoribosyltransferase family protein [Deltaproteobacteria bacterium]